MPVGTRLPRDAALCDGCPFPRGFWRTGDAHNISPTTMMERAMPALLGHVLQAPSFMKAGRHLFSRFNLMALKKTAWAGPARRRRSREGRRHYHTMLMAAPGRRSRRRLV